jgi:hypothetical protein
LHKQPEREAAFLNAMRIQIYTCLLAFFTFVSCGADFELGTNGNLSIAIPDDWSVSAKSADSSGLSVGYAFAFKPRNDSNAKCLLTFVYKANSVTNREAIRAEVLRITKQFVADSVEKKQNLTDFALTRGYGAYCLFTDATLIGTKSVPGEYKIMGSGRIQLNDHVGGVVSLFADDAKGKEMAAMIKIINSLKLKPK